MSTATMSEVPTSAQSTTPEAVAFSAYQNVTGLQRSMVPYFLFSMMPVTKEYEYRGVLIPSQNKPGTLVSHCKTWNMPNPGDRGKVAWLRVDSIITHQRRLGDDLNSEEADAIWKGEPEYMTVKAEALAKAMKDQMFGSMLAHNGRIGSPGVFIISGELLPQSFLTSGSSGVCNAEDLIVNGFPALAQEVKQAEDQQEALANWLLSRCSALAMIPTRIHEICDLDRNIVRWGIGETSASQYPWYGKQTVGSLKDCIACGGRIAKNALVCQHCGQNLVTFLKSLRETGIDISQFQDPLVMRIVLTAAPVIQNAAMVGIVKGSEEATIDNSTKNETAKRQDTSSSFTDKIRNQGK